jgi:hypothetical protein
MYHSLGFFLSVQPTRDVHPAASIGENERGGFAFVKIRDLALEHFRTNLWMLDRENAPKAATFFGVGQFNERRSFDTREQSTWLTIYAEITQQMTGWMIGQNTIPVCTYIGHTKYINEVFGKFVGTRGESFGTW